MTRLAFLVSGHDHGIAQRLAQLLQSECSGIGVDGVLSADVSPPRPDQIDVIVTSGTADPIPPALMADEERLSRTLLVICDRVGSPVFEGVVSAARRVGGCFAMDVGTAGELGARWAPTDFLPLGYSPTMDVWDRDRERDIDVVLVGTRTARRDGIEPALAGLAARHRMVSWAEPGAERHDDAAGLADPRRSLLARARVAVLVHPNGPDEGVDWFGAVDAILAGAAVVTERAEELAPLAAGRDVLSTGADALPVVVDALLDDQPRIDALCESAYRLLRGAPPLAAAVGQLVGKAWELRAGTWRAPSVEAGAP